MMDNVLPIDFPITSTPESRLMDELQEVIYRERNDEITVISILGILRLIETDLIDLGKYRD